MAPLRALVLLVAVTAVCGARIHLPVGLSNLRNFLSSAGSLHAHIQNNGAVQDGVENIIEKLEKLAEKIKTELVEAEEKLAQSLEDASENVAEKLNNAIQQATGVDLHLDDRLKNFEAKTAKCSATTKSELKALLENIKVDAEQCTSTQVAEAKALAANVKEMIELLETVPAQAIKNIKACETSSTDNGDKPADDDVDPDLPLDTNTDADDIPETKADDAVVNNHVLAVRSASDIINKAKCVAEQLVQAAQDFKEGPKLTYEIGKEIANLISKETQEELKKCASEAVSGKGTQLQKFAAELAYCIVEPSEQ